MKSSLLILVFIIGTLTVIASCKKPDEVKVDDTKAYTLLQDDLARSMKKASLVMRRLSRAVKNNDWVETDMWTQELKEGIGFSCVTQYMIENNDISIRFIMLSNQFNSAINKLILCSKKHDAENANMEFNNLVKSCDACHDSFNKDAPGQLDFSDSGEE
jgi:hypothetical protein